MGTEAPRVLMVIARFRPVIGGAERQAERLAGALARRGVGVTILTTAAAGAPAVEKTAGIVIHRLPSLPRFRLGRLKPPLLTLLFRRHLRQLGAGFDVWHVHQLLYPAAAACQEAAPLSISVIGKPGNGGAKFDLRVLRDEFLGGGKMVETIVDGLTRAVAMNPEQEQDLREFSIAPERIASIPNGVTLPALESPPLRSGLGLPEGRSIVIYCGRLVAQKRLGDLLQAVASLPAAARPLLLLLGDGPELPALRREAARLEIEQDVLLHGAVADVTPYLHAADLFALPSEAEGMSNSLLEAMACGLPVVVSDTPGNLRVVADSRCGVCYPTGDIVALTAALDSLMNRDAAAAMGRYARQHVEDCFSIETVADRYLDEYRRLIDSSNAR